MSRKVQVATSDQNVCCTSFVPACPSQVKKRTDMPLSLHGQLLWREFFYTAATNNPKFDQMIGNPICVQVPWNNNPEALAKWAEVSHNVTYLDIITLVKDMCVYDLPKKVDVIYVIM